MSKKLFLSKRSFFLFLSLVVVGAGAIFKGPVFHFMLKKYVSYKIPLAGEWDFNYSYMSLREKGVAFHDICLESKDRAVTCKIGRIFCYAPSLEKISLSNHYIIEDLDIYFAKQSLSEEALTADQMRSILRSLRQVEIKNGSIHIPSKKIDFSLEKSISPQKLGTLVFSQDLQGQVKVDLSSWADKWILDIEARQTGIAHYKEFFDFFMGEKASEWKIEKGKLDGRAFVAISSQNTIKDARLHVHLLDGKVSNHISGVSSSFDRVFIDMNYPISSEAKSVIDNIKISSSVDKGEIRVFNEGGDTRFHFKDLSGFITMDAFKEAAVDITGFIDDNGKMLPVKLTGSPAKKNLAGLELDFSLQLEQVFGHHASVNMICTHEQGEFLLKSRLDSLEVRQMLILQECLGLFNPSLREYTISKGCYSGDILMAFNNEGMKEFSLRNLHCDGLGIYSEKNDIFVDALKVSGELEIDLFHKKKTVLSAWEMDLEDGTVVIGRENGHPYQFENTNLKIIARDGKFMDSFITSEISGVKGRVDIDGSLQKPVFDVMVTSKGDDVLRWVSTAQHSYATEVMVSSRVEKLGDDYIGAGTITLHQEDHSSEVLFDLKVKDNMLEGVHFSSKKFLGMFYPFCNELFKFHWSVDGDFSFDGDYTGEKICCAFTGDNISYKEQHSFIKGASGSGYFEKDLINDTWFVDVNLKSGKKKIIDGKNLFLSNAQIRISSDDTFFKVRSLEGYMDLDEGISRLYVDVRKFDMSKNDIYHGDITFHNEDFELARISGTIKDKKVSLDEYSHLLEEKLALDICDFSEGLKVSLESILHLDDIAFPKMIRDRKFADVFCKVAIDGSSFQIDAKNNNSILLIQGTYPDFSITYNDVYFKGKYEEGSLSVGEGVLNVADKKIQIRKASLDRNSFAVDGQIEDESLLFSGEVKGFFDKGIHLVGNGSGSYTIPGFDSFMIKSNKDFSFSYDKKGVIEEGSFALFEEGQEISNFEIASICFHDNFQKISFHDVKGSVNKEVVNKRLQENLLNEELQFTAEVDIFPFEKDFWFSGKIGRKDFSYQGTDVTIDWLKILGNRKALVMDCSLPLYDTQLDLTSHLFFDDKILFQVDGFTDNKKTLEVNGCYKEELELSRIKGNLMGLDFDVTPSSEIGTCDYKIEAELDFKKMKPLFSDGALEFVERMNLGKGIEIIGGVTFKDGLTFDGIMKGTDFDFLDFSLSSLFGKLSYKDGICAVTDFSIADRALIASCEKSTFDSKGEGCLFSAKEFKVGNLRPCLLSKKGERKKLSNPFMLEKVDFQDVIGNLADLNTIKGTGSIHFVNSFDKETNPVFDIAKEIIGRIGLDPVLMVPVVGELDFNLADGKMNFIKMQDAYSDQKRSYFFLWHKTPSYIDYDGNINIDIRMKQYVLFKFTELFIISLDGSLADPKVHLK